MSEGKTVTQEEIVSFCRSFLKNLIETRGNDINELPNDAHLIRKGYIDSMDVFDLIGAIEDQYDVEFDFSEEDPDEIMTVNGLASYCYIKSTDNT